MLIIPGLNAKDINDAIRQVGIIAPLVRGTDSWIHIDISDGKFTSVTSWRNPAEFKELVNASGLSAEDFSFHLMVEDPEKILPGWLEAGAKWFVLHEESIKNADSTLGLLANHGAEAALSVRMDGIPGDEDLRKRFRFFQVLAVSPGPSGQKFNKRALDVVKFLRVKYPSVTIETDGGMNPETAKLVKDAGADVVVSTSYIQNNPNPKAAFEELSAI